MGESLDLAHWTAGAGYDEHRATALSATTTQLLLI